MTTSRKPLEGMTDAEISGAIRRNQGTVGSGEYAFSVPQLIAERDRRASLRIQRLALGIAVMAAIAAVASAVAAIVALLR